MSTIIQIKRTNTANLPTASGTLDSGELAYLYDVSSTDTDAGGNGGRLYIGDPTANTNTPIKVGGKYYTDMMDHSKGVLTANAALITDANKKLDNLKVDNIDFDTNTVSTATGDLILNPTGAVSIKGSYSLPNAIGTTGQALTVNAQGQLVFSSVSTSDSLNVQVQGGDSTSITLGSGNLEFDSGEGIDVSLVSGAVTIVAETATSSNKGVASFSSDDFVVTNGAVTLNQTALQEYVEDFTGGLTTAGEGITVTYNDTNGTLVVAGEDATDANKGIASFALTNFDVTTGHVSIKDGGITSSHLAGSIANGKLANSSVTFAADSGTANAIDLGSTVSILGGTGLSTTVSGSTITIDGADATTSTKGIASFDGTRFLVSSGAVDLATGSITETYLGTGAVTSVKIGDAQVTNAKLANSSLTIGQTSVALGNAITDLTNLTSVEVDDMTLNGSTITNSTVNGNLTLAPNGSGVVSVSSKKISNLAAPTTDYDAATKLYVDSMAQGLQINTAVAAATTQSLASETGGTVTYNNGTSGVGATLTLQNALTTLDGYTLQTDDRILIKNESTPSYNGVYVIDAGKTTLTRADDSNTPTEVTAGQFFFVQNGTVNDSAGFVQLEVVNTIGSDSIEYTQFSGAGQISVGSGLSKVGNSISVLYDNSTIGLDGINLSLLDNAVSSSKIVDGAVTNIKLANDSVTINGSAVALGGTLTLDSDAIAQGSTNIYFSDTLARAALSVQSNTGLAYDNSTGILSGVLATSSTKGVASFDANNFTVNSGVVTVNTVDGGAY